MKNLKEFFSSLDEKFKKNLIFILISYFLALFTYPMIRSATTTFFLEAYGAKSTPKAWLVAIIALSFVVWLANRVQVKVGVQKLYLGICLLSSGIFLGSLIGHFSGIKFLSYVLYIWKEIYIVLIIHLVFAYCNTLFSLEQMKRLYGYIGAMGGLGGVVGGLVGNLLLGKFSVSFLIYFSIASIFINGFIFLKTIPVKLKEKDRPDITPLSSIKDIKLYVALVAGIVALSQFSINIAELQFNLLFEKAVTGNVNRTIFQQNMYVVINGLSFLFQVFLVPYFFVRVSNKKIQYFVPIFYLLLSALGLGLGGGLMMTVAGTFVLFKATDYSIFAISKEILYHALTPIQKYGTKYITDMVVYRTAKGVIAAVLIFIQDLLVMRIMLTSFLVVWLLLLVMLFKKQSTLIEE